MTSKSDRSLLGNRAPDFELPGTDGEVYHLAPYLQKWQAIGAIFLSNLCPYSQGYLDRLKALQAEFQAQGVTLVGINANDGGRFPEETLEAMKAFASEHQLNFPYLRDSSHDVAQSFGAQQTPEVFLLDREGTICYHGAIDDSPNAPDAVSQPFLRQAIVALLAGEAIDPAVTETSGCPLR